MVQGVRAANAQRTTAGAARQALHQLQCQRSPGCIQIKVQLICYYFGLNFLGLIYVRR